MPGIERQPIRDVPQPVRTTIEVGDLALYQEAAARTGFTIGVTARAGDIVEVRVSRTGITRSVTSADELYETRQFKLGEGRLQIEIDRPEGTTSHQPFWNAQRELRAAQQNSSQES